MIGGETMVGQGWRMLMECLAAGRAISLPSSATAGAKAMLRFTSAYGRIRKQFGLPIGAHGGHRGAARAHGRGGLRERGGARRHRRHGVARRAAVGHLRAYEIPDDRAHAPLPSTTPSTSTAAAPSATGPSNYLQSAYQMVPVGITVEGANILTRTLITFAQGALRSHPYLYSEIKAAQDADSERGLDAFDAAFSDHIAFSVSNATGAFFHNLTGGTVRAGAGARLRHRPMVPPALAASPQLRLRRRHDGRRARRRHSRPSRRSRGASRTRCRSSISLPACSSASRTTGACRATATSSRSRPRMGFIASRRRCAASSTTSPSLPRAG